jgi:hypothetical protein
MSNELSQNALYFPRKRFAGLVNITPFDYFFYLVVEIKLFLIPAIKTSFVTSPTSTKGPVATPHF